jgi:hypothetical protein
MARIDWVRQRLEAWARWARECEAGALGYPKKSAFLRVGSGGGAMGSQALSDCDASLTDTAVHSLRFTHPHLHKTLQLYYIQGLDVKRVAKIMVKAESTIKAHLEASDHALCAWFTARQETQAKAQQVHTRASMGLRGPS